MYLQIRYVTPVYKRLLCNMLIQLHFDYVYLSWFLFLKELQNHTGFDLTGHDS